MKSLTYAVPLAALALALAVAGASRAQASGQPEFSVSTNHVAQGEHVFLIGSNLGAGLQVNVYDDSQGSPRFLFTADQNGEIHGDITDPNLYNSAQRYQAVYGTFRSTFLVSYEDGNPYPWNSVVSKIIVGSQDRSTNRTVTIKAQVSPRNAYQPQYASSLAGPWTPIGRSFPGSSQVSNSATWTFDVPDDTGAKFFRIFNPQGY